LSADQQVQQEGRVQAMAWWVTGLKSPPRRAARAVKPVPLLQDQLPLQPQQEVLGQEGVL